MYSTQNICKMNNDLYRLLQSWDLNEIWASRGREAKNIDFGL